ncbi:hypothetical protein KIPB_002301, partial [Kipferlia bialata]
LCDVDSEYSLLGETVCTTCPAGYSCSNAAAPSLCLAGTFSALGDMTCDNCSAGSYCPIGSSLETACLTGYWSASNADACTVCAAGKYCSDSAVSGDCLATQYSLEGESDCTICPAGYSCSDLAVPVLCSAGEYSAAGELTCTECGINTYCEAGAAAETSCPDGQMSAAGSGSCTQCGNGNIFDTDTGTCIGCVSGTYSIDGIECHVCPANYYCPDTDATTTIICEAGTWATGGFSACTECEEGFSCPASVSDTGVPVACGDGYYSDAKATSCIQCEAGYACPSPGKASDRYACGDSPGPVGSWSHAGSMECTQCVAGEKLDSASTGCEDCPAGFYTKLDGQLECIECAAGYECPNIDGTGILECTEGSYSLAGATACTSCPANSYCPDKGLATVTTCAAGTWATGGFSACTECEEGFYCPVSVSTTGVPLECPTGWYSGPNATACTECEAGYACPSGKESEKYACDSDDGPVGSWSTQGSTECTLCVAGEYLASDNTGCHSCSPGEYTSTDGALECISCPIGFACPNVDGSENVECPSGSYTLGGETACNDCLAGYSCDSNKTTGTACEDGYYSLGGEALCTLCPAGYYCDQPDEEPTLCADGYYSAGGTDTCHECPAGSRCPDPSGSPIECTSGYYSSAGSVYCTECDGGYFCGNGEVTATPAAGICPKGSYCPAGSKVSYLCPAGKLGSSTHLASIDECTDCPASYYCPAGTTDATPQTCEPGYYCPEGTRYASEFPCYLDSSRLATYSTSSGLSSQDQCTLCPAGKYCPRGQSDLSSFDCPTGYYCPEGTYSYATFPCPAGTYRDTTGAESSDECSTCTIGHYCPIGSTTATECPAGRYNPSTGGVSVASCLLCTEGHSCDSAGLSAVTDDCAAGHYCPAGTAGSTSHPCPAGTYTTSVSLTGRDQCTICPGKYGCPEGSADYSLSCAAGHYCPEGSPNDHYFPCPAGTYYDGIGDSLEAASECTPCTAGYYCPTGSTAVTEECPAGYYCEEGTTYNFETPCAAGTFRSTRMGLSQDDCSDCTSGHYCPKGSSEEVPCRDGYYTSVSNTYGSMGGAVGETCQECEAGYKCVSPCTTPVACPVGYYSAAGSSQCMLCEAGHYCSSEGTTQSAMTAATCAAGYYCPEGTDHAPAVADLCSTGHYCLAATELEEPCPAGRYRDAVGATMLTECALCPAGDYCAGGGAAVSGLCAAGHYCPEGSHGPTQKLCPAGTYNPSTSGESLDDCESCPAGSYCAAGCDTPVICTMGYYCPLGTATPIPCPIGTIGIAEGYNLVEQCDACDAGYFCDGLGRTTAKGLCDAGYYCTGGAYTSAPPNDETGGVCPAGGYCGVGSASKEYCLAGTYNPTTGASSEDDCISCPGGQYCEGNDSSETTGECLAGYYCDGGASTSTQHEAQAGYYAPAGSSSQFPCLPGTYNALAHQESCTECPEGSYCEDSTMDAYVSCPAGHYCPAGTIVPKSCPSGTFRADEGGVSIDDCTSCTAGMACTTSGLSAPDATCLAGYYCKGGAQVRDPIGLSDTQGDICPAGSYCEAQSETHTPCSPGYWSSTLGNTSVSDCSLCAGSKYCPNSGMSSLEGFDCDGGYYCVSGAIVATPTDGTTGDKCPLGEYCPAGSSASIPCPAGTVCASQGLSSPVTCSAGNYCPYNSQTETPCPAGKYCPAGTSSEIPLCPIGTYSADLSLSDESQCTQCDGGHYCPSAGLTESGPSCTEGYYCTSGCSSALGSGPADSVGGICPSGHYCPAGISSAQKCPAGTYRSNVGGVSAETSCIACDAGYYCPDEGMDAMDESYLCNVGFYCSGGASVGNPSDASGGSCAAGERCPLGSSAPIACSAGTYQKLAEQGVCLDCVAGYYCPDGAEDYESTPCNAGYYCPVGTTSAVEFPCSPGTYSAGTMMTSSDDCDACDTGHYCVGYAQTVMTGTCTAGYYCSGGATTATPATETEGGGRCGPGYYCPAGIATPTICPAGKYCPTSGLSAATLDCVAGSLCIEGASVSSPTDGTTGMTCPLGKYCLEGTTDAVECSEGSYNPNTGGTSSDACRTCDGGSYCSGTGRSAVSGDCQQGYFCPAGSTTANLEANICPVGHYCPTGSESAIPCEAGTFQSSTAAADSCDAGTYQNEEGEAVCLACPAGYYCLSTCTDYSPNTCPLGYYCPEGTSGPNVHPCPPGTYGGSSGLSAEGECLACTAGTYCAGYGLSVESGDCSEGYYCTSGASTKTPSSEDEGGDQCSPGNYCPEGSPAEIPCTVGKYCPTSGLAEATLDCAAGSICYLGASISAPIDGTTGEACPAGHYCPAGCTTEQKCPAGTYNPNTGGTSSDACQACDVGKYCAGEGLDDVTGDCDAGFYCPSGSSVSNPGATICPVGNYCPAGSADPLPCPAGEYQSSTGQSTCDECLEGYYCEEECATPEECPAGSYCPAGTTRATEFLCPSGTMSLVTGITQSSDCTSCAAGSYCAFPGMTDSAADCSSGYYCPAGQSSATPVDYICPIGSYCPVGSSTPTPCPSGTFAPTTQGTTVDHCTACTPGSYCDSVGLGSVAGDCDAGYYCSSGAVDSQDAECTVGHYCPVGSSSPISCPSGTYTDEVGQSECTACTAGYYCDGTSPSLPTSCPAGYYCPEGASSGYVFPCPIGTYNSGGGLESEDQCTQCPGGQYCGSKGLSAPSGDCSAGYICSGGNTASMSLANACPVGHYCEAGSSAAEPCPTGTYNPSTVGRSDGDCVPCPSGKYCDATGLSTPVGSCTAGYYCTGSSPTATPALVGGVDEYGSTCPIGYYCPEGSSAAYQCPAGEYQPLPGQSTCEACPERYYCDGNEITPVVCPPGYYCPAGSVVYGDNPCPIGTFSSEEGLMEEAECVACSTGSYCAVPGLSAPTSECSAGYYCSGGASTSTPSDPDANNDKCPAGYYCLEGTLSPVACPAGTYGISTGGTSEGDACIPCGSGDYCEDTGLTEATGQCAAGYFCKQGASSATPTLDATYEYYGPCPVGYMCEEGTSLPTACTKGTYNKDEGQSSCLDCPAGFYCETSGVSEPVACPAGYYCPTGTVNFVDTPCPPGTYSGTEGLSSEDSCVECSPGMACPSAGLSAPAGNCNAGYYCEGGSDSYSPTDSTGNAICPVGHYCDAGSASPVQCPAGTYNPSTKGDSISDCLACTAGMYCESEGLSSPTSYCAAGYYCPSSESISDSKPDAFICPAGSYCPAGSASAIEVPSGNYQSDEGASSYETCPKGYYCMKGSSTPTICPAGNYCPVGSSTGTKCDAGTYSLSEGLGEASECLACISGSYCLNGVVADECTGGYYCTSGASTPTPFDGTTGDICPIGSYCPPGSSSSTPCPDNTWSTSEGADDIDKCGTCPAGYICTSLTIEVCPAGYYCPLNEDPQACPVNTYNPDTQSSDASSCITCPAGYLCDEVAVTSVSSRLCDVGSYCPQGTPVAVKCPAGTYRTEAGGASADDCVACSAGHYCPLGSQYEIECSAGYYCPDNSSSPTLCSAGTWYQDNADIHESLETTCFDCPVGYYCADSRRTSYAMCEAGYICTGSATTGTPLTTEEGGYICPSGYYCEAGALTPSACPPGTYGASTGLGSIDECTSCLPGSYQHLYGQSACSTCGASSYSEEGAVYCECTGTYRAFQTTDASCLCYPGYEFYDAAQQLGSGDSTIDCQRIVYDRCTTARDASGNCITYDSDGNVVSCSEFCVSGSGTYDSSGICVCSDLQDEDTICNAACRASATEVTYATGDDTLSVTDPSTGTTSEIDTTSDSFVGQLTCSSADGCSLHAVVGNDEGFVGVYNLPDGYFSTEASVATTKSDDVTGIRQPIMCLLLGEGIVWDVSAGHYPVYEKDSLFNSNDDFDYGVFRTLARKIEAGGSVSVFAYTFTEAGVYVFYDAGDTAKRMIVTVLEDGESCGNAYAISTTKPETLAQLGISLSTDIVLAPDWVLILLFSMLAVSVVGGIISAFLVFNKRSWGSSLKTQPKYRSEAKSFNLDSLASKGQSFSKHKKVHPAAATGASPAPADAGSLAGSLVSANGAAGETEYRSDFWDFERQVDIEGFSARDLYKQLDSQTSSIADIVSGRQGEFRHFYQSLRSDMDQLRQMVVGQLNMMTEGQDKLGEAVIEDHSAALEQMLSRKSRASAFAAVLRDQYLVVTNELKQRQAFELAVRSTQDMISGYREDMMKVILAELDDPNAQDIEEYIPVIDDAKDAINALVDAVRNELDRRGLDDQSVIAGGALIITPSGVTIDPQSLVGEGGDPVAVDSITFGCPNTGLIHPQRGVDLQLASGEVLPVSTDNAREFCVLPVSGMVVPCVASVLVQRNTGSVVHVAQTVFSQDLPDPEGAFLPYHPTPPFCSMVIPSDADMVLSGGASAFTDPVTGFKVPVLSVTVDHRSGVLIPLGGTVRDPISNALVPLADGQPFMPPIQGEDTDSEVILPIGGIGFSTNGQVIPLVAATPIGDGERDMAAGFGNEYIDPMTGVTKRSTGLWVPTSGDNVHLFTGPNETRMSASELFSLLRYAEAVSTDVEALHSLISNLTDIERLTNASLSNAENMEQRATALASKQASLVDMYRQANTLSTSPSLMNAIEETSTARRRSKAIWIRNALRLKHEIKECERIEATGEVPPSVLALSINGGHLSRGIAPDGTEINSNVTESDIQRVAAISDSETASRQAYHRQVEDALARLKGEIETANQLFMQSPMVEPNNSAAHAAELADQIGAMVARIAGVETLVESESQRRSALRQSLANASPYVRRVLNNLLDTSDDNVAETLSYMRGIVDSIEGGASDVADADIKIIKKLQRSRDPVSSLSRRTQQLGDITNEVMMNVANIGMRLEASERLLQGDIEDEGITRSLVDDFSQVQTLIVQSANPVAEEEAAEEQDELSMLLQRMMQLVGLDAAALNPQGVRASSSLSFDSRGGAVSPDPMYMDDDEDLHSSMVSRNQSRMSSAMNGLEQQRARLQSRVHGKDERTRLLRQLESERQALEQSLNEEAARQKNLLDERLAARQRARDASRRVAELENEVNNQDRQKEEEEAALDSELAAETAATRDAVTASITSAGEAAKQQLESAHQAELSGNLTDSAKAALLKRHAEEAARLEEHLASEAERQRGLLQAELKARRKRRMLDLAKQSANDNYALSTALEQAKAELAESEMAAEEAEKVSAISDMLTQRHVEATSELTTQLGRELASCTTSAGRAAILQQHDENLQRLDNDLAVERQKQMADLRQRLSLRNTERQMKEAQKEQANLRKCDTVKANVSRDLVEAETAEEEAQELRAQAASAAAQQHEEEMKLRKKTARALAGATTAAERRQLLAQHDERELLLQDKLTIERERQDQALQARLLARKKRRIAEIERKRMHTPAPRPPSVAAAPVDVQLKQEVTQMMEDVSREYEQEAEQDVIEEKQEADDFEARQRSEEEALEKELEAQNQAELKRMQEKQQEAITAAVADLEKEHDRIKAKKMSADKKGELLAANRAHVAKIEEGMQEEQARQNQMLEQKLAMRAKRRRMRLQQRQQAESREALVARCQAADSKARARAEVVEKRVIQEISERGDGQVSDIVELTLQNRHTGELEQLVARHSEVRERIDAETSAMVDAQYAEREEEMLTQNMAELEQLSARTDIDAATKDRLRADTEGKHRAMSARLRQQHESAKADSLADSRQRLEEELARERSDLFTRQLSDRMKVIQELFPEAGRDALVAASAQQQELDALRMRMMTAKEAEVKAMEERRAAIVEEETRRMQAEFAEIERKQQEEKAKHGAQIVEARKRLELQQAQLLAAEKKKQLRRLSMAHSDGQRAQLIAEFQAQTVALEGALNSERERQYAQLEAMLNKRREAKRKQRIKAAQREMADRLKEEEEARARRLEALEDERQQNEVAILEQQEEEALRATEAEGAQVAEADEESEREAEREPALLKPSAGRHARGKHTRPKQGAHVHKAKAKRTGALDRGSVLAAFEGSELYTHMAAIVAASQSGLPKVVHSPRSPRKASQGLDTAALSRYCDDRDALFTPGTSLSVVPKSKLSPREQATLAESNAALKRMLPPLLKNVSLRVASSMPVQYPETVFPRSYNYSAKDKILFIRRDRLKHTGELGVVLAHAVAHVETNTSADADPKFVRAFYSKLASMQVPEAPKAPAAPERPVSSRQGARGGEASAEELDEIARRVRSLEGDLGTSDTVPEPAEAESSREWHQTLCRHEAQALENTIDTLNQQFIKLRGGAADDAGTKAELERVQLRLAQFEERLAQVRQTEKDYLNGSGADREAADREAFRRISDQ